MVSLSGEATVINEGIALKYLAEGAANIVYCILPSCRPSTPEQSAVEEYRDGTPPPSIIDTISIGIAETQLQNKLVRFRKDKPTTAPCHIAQANWERLIKPLFSPHQLVHQALVELQPSHVSKLNEDLRNWESGKKIVNSSIEPTTPRPDKRQRTYLADDDHALIITDMTSRNEEQLIEFKPKWLAQSPSAPRNSKRCRQCAHMARINAKGALRGQQPASFFCPLDLTSQDLDDVNHVAGLIVQSSVSVSQIKSFAQWLRDTQLLNDLKARQLELDKKGVMQGDVGDEKFLIAMTLRDCTVFVKCTLADPPGWEARIGDLDLKSKDKIDYWRSIEKSLIEEGWYEGTENKENQQPIFCRLSRDLGYTLGID